MSSYNQYAIEQVYGLPWEHYVFIKCDLCGFIYRWGVRALGVVQCPVCGAWSFRPHLVDKTEYIKQMQKLTTNDIMRMQREKWNPRRFER